MNKYPFSTVLPPIGEDYPAKFVSDFSPKLFNNGDEY